jgi:transcriptional regulator with XRE-family HTH domain
MKSTKAIADEEPGAPPSLDKAIGLRVRELRLERGLSQKELGAAIGVTAQQMQKYESGANRLAASALLGLARTMGVAMSSLYPNDTDDAVYVSMLDNADFAALAATFAKLSQRERKLLLGTAKLMQRLSDPEAD